jgi:hypothetical protein
MESLTQMKLIISMDRGATKASHWMRSKEKELTHTKELVALMHLPHHHLVVRRLKKWKWFKKKKLQNKSNNNQRRLKKDTAITSKNPSYRKINYKSYKPS